MSRYPYDPDYQPREDRLPLIYTLAVIFYGTVIGLIVGFLIWGVQW